MKIICLRQPLDKLLQELNDYSENDLVLKLVYDLQKEVILYGL